MKTVNFVTAACIALGTTAAMAQTSPQQVQSTPPAGMTPFGGTMQQMGTPATGMATGQNAQPSARAQVSDEDKKFVRAAAIGGMFEVQSSQLATTMSQNNEVRQFAQQMIGDHTQANQQLMQLAGSKQIRVPGKLDKEHTQMLKKLSQAQGPQFDQAFVKAQVQAHQEMVALFQKAATNLQDPQLKAFAAQTLPVLQNHLQMASQFQGASGSAGASAPMGAPGASNNSGASAPMGASNSGSGSSN